ncbi:hypothetical protein CRI94_06180 [Longibacter salinarum]|uniref:Uncharacterized protein n=1 Tax=Longibacter salinarum TaxID=1850348 RepID=A0A2A8D107_9BACT|nr:hypothetical protein CRI94_06180 [Longibacter salinarum]
MRNFGFERDAGTVQLDASPVRDRGRCARDRIPTNRTKDEEKGHRAPVQSVASGPRLVAAVDHRLRSAYAQ